MAPKRPCCTSVASIVLKVSQYATRSSVVYARLDYWSQFVGELQFRSDHEMFNTLLPARTCLVDDSSCLWCSWDQGFRRRTMNDSDEGLIQDFSETG